MRDEALAAVLSRVATLAREEGRATLLEPEALEILEALGLATPRRAFARDAREAEALAAGLPGERVVVKVVAPEILHKTDVGGVRIVHRTPGAVADAVDGMAARLAGRGVRGWLLVEHVAHDPSVAGSALLGLRWTEDFGPVVTLGPGGVHAEFLAARMRPERGLSLLSPLRRAPGQVEAALADGAMTALWTRPQRGAPAPTSPAALAQVVGRFLDLAARACPDPLAEFEVNPLVATAQGLVALDARALLGGPPAAVPPPRPLAKVARLLAPRRIAFVGVSERTNPGRIILRNVLREGFPPEDLCVVKPGVASLDGVRCVPDLASLPAPVDLFVVAVDARQAVAAVEEAVERRAAESVILIPGGLGETEGSGGEAERLARAVRRDRGTPWGGLVVNGGNCLGVRSVPGRYNTLFIPEHKLRFPPGPPAPLAMLSQSGAFAVSWASKLGRTNPRYVVTMGNQSDLTVSDYLAHVAQDPDVRVVACYVEGFRPRDGERFLEEAARAVASGRDVVLYRAGRSEAGARAMASHTASVAGDWVVGRALCRAAGVLVADSLDDFADLTRLLCALADKRVAGRGLAAVSNAGFECVAIADHAGPFELVPFAPATRERLAGVLGAARLTGIVGVRNPLDVTPILGDEGFDDVVGAVLDDPGVDVAVVGCVPLSGALWTLPAGPGHAEDLGAPRSVVARLARRFTASRKAWVVVVDAGPAYDPMARALDDAGVPTFRAADRALALLARYVEGRLARGGGVPLPVPPRRAPGAP